MEALVLLIVLSTWLLSGYLQGMYHVMPSDWGYVGGYGGGVRAHRYYTAFHWMNRAEVVLLLLVGNHLLNDPFPWHWYALVVLWAWECREIGYNLARYNIPIAPHENFLGEEGAGDSTHPHEITYTYLSHTARIALGGVILLLFYA